MTVPERFPAFLATRHDDTVQRGPGNLAADDLPGGEVTIRVHWSSRFGPRSSSPRSLYLPSKISNAIIFARI